MARASRSRSSAPPAPAGARFYALAALLVAVAALGGSSRSDAVSLLLLRPVVVMVLGALLLMRGRTDWRLVRVPLALLGAFAATMAIQLMPLPPTTWASLPGHAPLTPSLALAEPGWRPISLDPDMTLNALVALLPVLATLVGYAAVSVDERRRLLGWLVAIVLASAMLGLVQLVSGGQSPAYLYRATDFGLPVGLLANRNHQAVLLALSIPALWLWMGQSGRIPQTLRLAVAGGGTLVALPMILMTGSRAGMAAALLALAVTPWVAGMRVPRARRRLAVIGVGTAAVLLVGLAAYTIYAGQAFALDRLAGTDLAAEKRVRAFPVLLRMLADFFPIGMGHGAFEPVFRAYEPDALLMPTYFNRAHNDLLEVAMSGGAPAILVVMALIAWLGLRTVQLLRRGERGLARLGAVIAWGWLAASLADYPLRTPLVAVLFALACLWLDSARAGTPRVLQP